MADQGNRVSTARGSRTRRHRLLRNGGRGGRRRPLDPRLRSRRASQGRLAPALPRTADFTLAPDGIVVGWWYEDLEEETLDLQAARTKFTMIGPNGRTLPGRWPITSIGTATAPVIAKDGSIFYTSETGKVWGHDRSGNIIDGWPYRLPYGVPPELRPDGRLLFILGAWTAETAPRRTPRSSSSPLPAGWRRDGRTGRMPPSTVRSAASTATPTSPTPVGGRDALPRPLGRGWGPGRRPRPARTGRHRVAVSPAGRIEGGASGDGVGRTDGGDPAGLLGAEWVLRRDASRQITLTPAGELAP